MSAASHRTSEASHSLDGTKTIGQLNRELQEVHDRQAATARCAWCPWTFEGTAVEARDAFAFHRSSAHPDRVNGASARELLDRMDAGESVAVATGPVLAGTCKREGCTEPPKHIRGRYALLCEAHADQLKESRKPSRRIVAWSTEEIIAAIKRWAEEHGAPPTANAWTKKQDGCPACSTVLKHFGSWANAIEAAGFPRPTRGGQPAVSADPPPAVAKPARKQRRPKVQAARPPARRKKAAGLVEIIAPDGAGSFAERCELEAVRHETAAVAYRQVASGIRTLEELARD